MSGMKDLVVEHQPLSMEARMLRLEVALCQLEEKAHSAAVAAGLSVCGAYNSQPGAELHEVLDEVRRARQAVADAAKAARRVRSNEGHKP